MTKEQRTQTENDLSRYEQQLQEYRQAATRLEGVIIYLRQQLDEKEATSGGQEN